MEYNGVNLSTKEWIIMFDSFKRPHNRAAQVATIYAIDKIFGTMYTQTIEFLDQEIEEMDFSTAVAEMRNRLIAAMDKLKEIINEEANPNLL